METTTLRVHKTTQEKLKKLSATERLSMMQLIVSFHPAVFRKWGEVTTVTMQDVNYILGRILGL